MFGSSLPPVVCRGLMSYLLYLCWFTYCSVQHILCCVLCYGWPRLVCPVLLFLVVCPVLLFLVVCPVLLFLVVCPVLLFLVVCPVLLFLVVCPVLLFLVVCPVLLFLVVCPVLLFLGIVYSGLSLQFSLTCISFILLRIIVLKIVTV